MSKKVLTVCCFSGVVLLFFGCGRRGEDVTVYQVPKEQPAAQQQEPVGPFQRMMQEQQGGGGANSGNMQVLPGMVEQTQGFGTPTWQVPEAWEDGPPSQMRKGSFTIPGAPISGELSITVFPGDVGGLLANVNRWRREVGLSEVETPQLPEVLRSRPISGVDAHTLFFAGKSPGPGQPERGILGAIVPHGGGTWFFKMTGPTSLLEAEQERFFAFLDTVKLPE